MAPATPLAGWGHKGPFQRKVGRRSSHLGHAAALREDPVLRQDHGQIRRTNEPCLKAAA